MLTLHRVLTAGVRTLGKYCCPIDRAEKHHLDLLGTTKSRQIIATRMRSDNDSHRRLINAARSLIYEKGLTVRSAEVEKKLFDASLVPTLVCQCQSILDRILSFCRVRSQKYSAL
jgi:hypothetical protein